MKFNPPPNWPQLPAGWTPPPGWQPDPSWPQPPYGWRLWVAEDEFVISPQRVAVSRAQSTTEPWHRRTVYIVLLLIFCFPVGLVLLWLRNDWSVRRRGIVTAAVGIAVIIALPSVNSTPTTTTVLNSTAVGGTASSSPAPASSRPAAPSPAVTTTKASPPVTSAPPKTTAAAAPVRTSAAPVYTPAPAPTTQAPQPVQTTAQTQGCYPLTSGGNCYTPGEYCRKADRDTSGVDADGDAITCEDNDGWRWERT
jgi:hypothetical protein